MVRGASATAGFEPRFTTCCCRRRAEELRDLRRDRKAGEGHGRTRGRYEESAFRPGVTQDALRQDPPLLFRQPGQRETLQGTSVSNRPACLEETADANVWSDLSHHRGSRRLHRDRARGGKSAEISRKTSLRLDLFFFLFSTGPNDC